MGWISRKDHNHHHYDEGRCRQENQSFTGNNIIIQSSLCSTALQRKTKTHHHIKPSTHFPNTHTNPHLSTLATSTCNPSSNWLSDSQKDTKLVNITPNQQTPPPLPKKQNPHPIYHKLKHFFYWVFFPTQNMKLIWDSQIEGIFFKELKFIES